MGKQKDTLLYRLKTLYESGGSYHRLGDNVIVAVNAHHPPQQNQNQHQVSLDYVAEYKSTTPSTQALPLHLYQAVNQCYLHMRRTAIDQSILLRFVYCTSPIILHALY